MRFASSLFGLVLVIPISASAQEPHAKHHPPRVEIPKSVQAEHRELHTQSEEEVCYPAAVLVGRLLRRDRRP